VIPSLFLSKSSKPLTQFLFTQDDPLANDVAQHYKSDEAGAIQLSREWTTKYAKP
jgi:ubiquitin-protein ligase